MLDMALELAKLITLEGLHANNDRRTIYAARRAGIEEALASKGLAPCYERDGEGITAVTVDGNRVEVIRL